MKFVWIGGKVWCGMGVEGESGEGEGGRKVGDEDVSEDLR